jgi:hypothetical protein
MLCCELFAFDFLTRIYIRLVDMYFLNLFFGMFAWRGASGILLIRLVGDSSGKGTRYFVMATIQQTNILDGGASRHRFSNT